MIRCFIFSGSKLGEIQSVINNDLNNLFKWLYKNKLILTSSVCSELNINSKMWNSENIDKYELQINQKFR